MRVMRTKTRGRKGGIESKKRSHGLLGGFSSLSNVLSSPFLLRLGKDEGIDNSHTWYPAFLSAITAVKFQIHSSYPQLRRLDRNNQRTPVFTIIP